MSDRPPSLSTIPAASSILPARRIPAVVVLLLLVDSLHFVFARLLHPFFPQGVGAFYVLAVATVETAVFLSLRRGIRLQVFRQHAGFFLAIGFLVAAATALNYVAVGYIDPGTASMLAQTSTVFALGLGGLWLREKLNWGQIIGASLAIVGGFIITFQTDDILRLGSFLVLGSAFVYALHAAVVKRFGGAIEFANFFLFRVASTTFFLLLFFGLQGTLSWPREGLAWVYLILAGTVDVVISRVLYYLVLREIRMSIHAILLTLSPVATILWSLVLFNELPSGRAWIGGTAVVAGVLLVTVRARKKGVFNATS